MRHYCGPIFLPQVANAIGGGDPRTAPSWPSGPPTAITASSPIERATPWLSRPTIATTPRSRMPSETSSTARAQPSPLRSLPSQRRLAGGPGPAPYSIRGPGPRPGTLDNAHRPGRAGSDHQDPLTALLLSDRTAHPQGPPPHPASDPVLAPGSPVQ